MFKKAFIGKRDSYDNEIREGDIVEYTPIWSPLSHYAIVKYREERACFSFPKDCHKDYPIKRIGNLHDEPELAKLLED